MIRARTKSPAEKKPRFFRQGLLIFLPVVLLAVAGWFSVVQDKQLVRAEMANIAQITADNQLGQVVNHLKSFWIGTNGARFNVYRSGRLSWPPPVDDSLVPQVFDSTDLAPEQAHFWQLLEEGIQHREQFSEAIAAGQHFIALNPPAAFAAKAAFDVGSMLLGNRQFEEAAEVLKSVADKYGDGRGETGLHLQDLAEMKLLELAYKDVSRPANIIPAVQRFWARLIHHPTILSPHLWERATQLAEAPGRATDISGWAGQFARENRIRDLFALLEPELLRRLREKDRTEGRAITSSGAQTNLPPTFWYWTDYLPMGPPAFQTNRWLVLCEPWFLDEYAVKLLGTEKELRNFLQSSFPNLDFDIAGRAMLAEKSVVLGKTSGLEKASRSRELLATSKSIVDGAELARVNVFMEPDGMFAFQKQRMQRFGVLIALAILVALLGLVSARNAFHRQVALSEMKSNFVSSVSHELRAPIASVRLMAESLERGKITDATKQNDYFRFIVQECRRLTALIENVLDFSRIEQDRKQYDFEATDTVRLLQETCKLMEPAAAERQVRLMLEWDEVQLATVESQLVADGRALQQALVNLIDNAIKHSPSGAMVRVGARLGRSLAPRGTSGERGISNKNDLLSPALSSLSGEGEREETRRRIATASVNPHLCFWVEDQGSGIPRGEHQKIFERFYRRGSELRRETQGVGIGLSIVKHIVEAHGGEITVRSEPGQGSRFTIELPLRQEMNARKTG